MGIDQDRERYLESYRAEVDSAFLYDTLARLESEPKLAELYRSLAEAEQRHARFWLGRLDQLGVPPAAARPSGRARVLAWLARRFGSEFILPTLIDAEAADSRGYLTQPEVRGTAMARDERSHRLSLQALAARAPTGITGPTLARFEGRHRTVGGNALRAAVLGANDGLVSNLSLVMGVAGAALSSQAVLITGFAGLLAGAISMALGEWLSVQSSRELHQRQLAIEAQELEALPEEEAAELTLIYQAKGVPEAQARALASQLMASERVALDTLAREELGIDPEELGGSARTAAFASFALFAVGAIFPVLPFMFLSGAAAVAGSLALSALALFGIGAAITLLTGRGLWTSGLRQTLFGLTAAAVTYGVGWLLGVSLAG